MAKTRTLRSDLFRIFLFTLISLFAVPAVTQVFTRYALHSQDVSFQQSVEERIAANPRLSPTERDDMVDFYRRHPLSAACTATAPEDQNFHDKVCPAYSMEWQFHIADRVAFWTLAGGVALLAVAAVLAALAFANRSLRYTSFVAGWRLMSLSSAAEVLVQSAMVVWLSFWLTAFFWHSYYVKLVALAAIFAAMAAFYAVYTLFKKLREPNEIEGELLAEPDAPRLWNRIRELAARVGTPPPDHIVAGIDTNFFVTEVPCTVDGRAIRGRTLFVSLPLLRVLDATEADAVLAHELAHLAGGDTHSSALLGPKLRQFDQYTLAMRTGGLTVVAHYLLRLYRMVFEMALARDSREREHLADRTAARLVAPEAIVQSLVKISAYASYRHDVENKLFAHDHRYENALGIAGFVSEGLHPYADSPAFLESMKTADVPHPYDSHPPLAERMRNVGHSLAESEFGTVVKAAPAMTWVDDIQTAADIEQRLWDAYEKRFAEQHERALAYRYEPTGEEETALVLRYFPPCDFALAKDQHITITYAGIEATGNKAGPIAWDEVKGLTFQDGNFSTALVVTHHDKGMLGARKTSLNLRGIGKNKQSFKDTVGHYWQRHQVMRAQQKQHADDEGA